MDLRKIKKLIELVEESGITELEVRAGEEAVRIARPAPGHVPVATTNPSTDVVPAAPPAAAAATEVIRAPMAGTFYSAPSPGAPPFVEPGSTVAAGQVVCIIESMKMMNQIEASVGGVVAEVLVANESPIETGQPLFRIR